MPTDAILELVDVSRNFGAVRVLENLTLSVARGEILGVLGPNGAGKSTLFNVVAGVLPPTSGRIDFDGKPITALKVWDRCRAGIGRTYQIPKPFTHMSVFENVLVAAVHGGRLDVSAARPIAVETLERTGLAHRARMPAAALSLLDLKRLEFAKALAQRPRLILLDEIAGGLTDAECDVLLEIVRGAHGAGATIVWIEHVIHVLRRAASRLVVLYGGGVIASGTPQDVLADPRVQEVYLGA